MGALELVSTTIKALKHCRDTSEQTFAVLYESIKSKHGELKIPRRCSKQNNRSNVVGETPKVYFRRSIFVPLLDGVINNLEKRFGSQTTHAMKLSFLLPCNIISNPNTYHNKVSEAFRFWQPILLEPKTEQQVLGEWDVWAALWTGADEDKPSDALTSLVRCDAHAFPTIHRLLLVFATQPVTTSTPERTFSTLRRLKTWLRCTIREDRLTGLALMAMHRERFNLDDAECILNNFVKKRQED